MIEINMNNNLENLYPVETRTTSQQFKITIDKLKQNPALLYLKETGNGVNGAQFIKEHNTNKIVGVFKKPSDKFSCSNFVKSFVGQLSLLNRDHFSREYGEVAAHIINKQFGFNVAPKAKLAQRDGEQGVAIEFFDGKPLGEYEKIFEKKANEFTEEEKTKWQIMCLFNFFVDNLDPHKDNLFLNVDDKGKILKARTIDFGNAFPVKRPKGYYGHEGAWGGYSISTAGFTKETLTFIKENFTEENLELALHAIDQKCPNFMKPKMKQHLKERYEILTMCVGEENGNQEIKMITTPLALSKIHYRKDYLAYAPTIRAVISQVAKNKVSKRKMMQKSLIVQKELKKDDVPRLLFKTAIPNRRKQK